MWPVRDNGSYLDNWNIMYGKVILEIILANSDLNQPLQKYIPENTSPKKCCMHAYTHTEMSTRQTKEIIHW